MKREFLLLYLPKKNNPQAKHNHKRHDAYRGSAKTPYALTGAGLLVVVASSAEEAYSGSSWVKGVRQ